MNDAMLVWDALKSKIASHVKSLTGNCLRCERYDVTTAPNGSVIGVTQPFGNAELFIPYSQEVANAVAGDTVLVAWHNTMSNAKAISYGDGFRGSPSNVSNPNLLDNWYFGNPVNQRGNNSYNLPSIGYSFDRWRGYKVIAEKTNDYVQLTNNFEVNGNWGQPIENASQFVGLTVTFSILMDVVSNVRDIGLTWIDSSRINNLIIRLSPAQTPAGKRIYSATFTVPNGFSGIGIYLYSASGYSDTVVKLYAMKLELGSVQTLAHQENGVWVLNEIPDYGDQLRRCQRYYIKISGSSIYGNVFNGCVTDGIKKLLVSTNIGEMRTTPSGTITPISGQSTTGIIVRGIDGYSPIASYNSPYSGAVITLYNKGKCMTLARSDNSDWVDMTPNTPISVSLRNVDISLTADL